MRQVLQSGIGWHCFFDVACR